MKTGLQRDKATAEVRKLTKEAEEDIDAAVLNVFMHPNTPPFVSKQLIQRLVTGNPSNAYVARIAAVFADNGAGVRGDQDRDGEQHPADAGRSIDDAVAGRADQDCRLE